MDYRALIAKYFPADQVENALRVMMGESSGDPRAHATQGEDSRGLFQLNVAQSANPQLARYNLYDPETNVRLAAQMYNERGWQPWTAAQKLGIVGKTSQEDRMPEPSYRPDQLMDEFWIDLENKDAEGRALVYDHAPTPGQFWEKTPKTRHVVRIIEDDGKIYDVDDSGVAKYVRTDAQVATGYRAGQPNPTNPTSEWSIQEKKDGSKVRVNELTGEVQPLQGFGPTQATTTPKYYETDQGIVEVMPRNEAAQGWSDPTASGLSNGGANLIWNDPNAGRKQALIEAQIEAQNRSGQSGLLSAAETARRNAWLEEYDPWKFRQEQDWNREERGIQEQGLNSRNEASLANSRTTTQMNNDADMLRQRLSTAGTLSDSIARNTLAAQQYAMDPSWNGIAPGFEKDGAYGQLLKFAGAQPRNVQLPQIQFDPLMAWRLAQGATGAK